MNEVTTSNDINKAPTLLHENENVSLLSKISSIFSGFCPTKPIDDDADDDDNDDYGDEYPHQEDEEKRDYDHTDSNDISNSRSEEEVLVVKDDQYQNQQPLNSSSTHIMLNQAPDCHQKNQEIEKKNQSNVATDESRSNESAFSQNLVASFKFIISPLVYCYLLTTISYYHFGIDSIFDMLVLRFLTRLKAFIEPYASTIVVIQLFTFPLLYFVHNKGSKMSERNVEVENTERKKRRKIIGIMNCCRANVESQVVISNRSEMIEIKPQVLNDMVYDTHDTNQKSNNDKEMKDNPQLLNDDEIKVKPQLLNETNDISDDDNEIKVKPQLLNDMVYDTHDTNQKSNNDDEIEDESQLLNDTNNMSIDDNKVKVKSQVLHDTRTNNMSNNDDEIKVKPKVLNDMVFDSTHDTSDISYDDEIDEINVDLDEATRNLPPEETWKYRPVFIQAAGDTMCPGQDPKQSLPIGVPFDFESNLFKGKALFRFRTGETDDPKSSKAYFDASKLKLQRQLVIQGQFKRRTKMSEVWIGDIYDKKLRVHVPLTIAKFISRLFSRLAPGVVIDLISDKPKVLVLIGSGSHTLSIDEPGEEPDIMKAELPEKTPISNDMKSSEHRKRVLGKPDEASEFEFDPKLVYTFNTTDEALDLADYKFRIPILTIDFTKVLGDGQPMSFRAVQGDTCSSNSYFFFRIWHERVLVRARESKERNEKK